MNLGALFGALVAGFLMEKFGRKLVLISMSLPFVMSWLLIALAVHPSKLNLIQFDLTCSNEDIQRTILYLGMLYIGRILGGWAGGVCSVVAPSYVGKF